MGPFHHLGSFLEKVRAGKGRVYRACSRDFTAAMLVSLLNSKTAAMLVPKPVLWELNAFLMLTLSFVEIININVIRVCL